MNTVMMVTLGQVNMDMDPGENLGTHGDHFPPTEEGAKPEDEDKANHEDNLIRLIPNILLPNMVKNRSFF